MTPVEAIASGCVQGLTEFFPISSSGHLVFLHRLFGLEKPRLVFDLFLHLGTTLAIVITFWKDLVGLLTRERRLLGFVVFGFLPTGVMGFLFAKPIEKLFLDPRAVSISFLITALWLWVGSRREGNQGLNGWRAFVIGISQGIAMVPGISRTGATIATGLLLGVAPQEALRYSFFLAIPTIVAAFLYETLAHPVLWDLSDGSLWLGVGISFVVGLFAIRTLRSLMQRRRLHVFSLYLLVLGTVGLLVFR